MSFGRNPHLPKAQAAEQKAADALDVPARVLAYREAAHQWERAAARENPGKKRTEYEQNAAKNRELADAGDGGVDAVQNGVDSGEGSASAAPRKGQLLN
ncbi:MAG: hypothetical protein JWN04_594 [Myxococcaceae bacterium]|nr:hypothetical protein [Myxococcaceae bacterium]